jgi:SAM-dependent methyltransferase
MLPLPPGGGQLLDVGCGNGDFLSYMRGLGWSVRGLDFDPVAVEACESQGITAFCGSLEEAQYEENQFDAITLGHVIEHVHDPEASLRACYRILKPGGLLYLETPNIESSGHQRWGKHWRGLEPPRHLIIFTPKSLAALTERTGFRTERMQGAAASFPIHIYSRSIAKSADPGASTNWEPIEPAVARELKREERQALASPDSSEIFMLLVRKPAQA